MPHFRNAPVWLALISGLTAPCATSARGQELANTVSTRQAMELPPRDLATVTFGGLAGEVKEVWRPAGLATAIGLTRLAFAASAFPSGYTGICAVDRWEVEFKAVSNPEPLPPSRFADAPAKASRLHVTRLYKVTGPVSGAYALGEANRAMLMSCPLAGSARAFFDLQGEQDMLLEALAAINAAIDDRKAHLGKYADWVCADASEAKEPSCPSAEQMHILNLESVSHVEIKRCHDYGDQYCIDVNFSPGGRDSGLGAVLNMAGVRFSRLEPRFVGVKVAVSFASSSFKQRLVVYD